MNDLIALFESIFPINEDEKELILASIKQESIEKNEVYCPEGKVCKRLGFVAEGIFKCVRIDNEGNEYIPYFIERGHFAVALESFSNQVNSNESIQALTHSTVFTISRSVYNLFEERITNFSRIIATLKERALIEKNNLKSELINLSAEVRYEKLLMRQPDVIKYVSQKNIAQYLGITQYTLSRIRKSRVSG